MSYFQGFGPPFHYNRFQGIDEDNDQGGRDESPATFGMEQGGTRAPGWISCQRHYGAARGGERWEGGTGGRRREEAGDIGSVLGP